MDSTGVEQKQITWRFCVGRHKGSVTHCSYCYKEGHNRRTCPQLMAYVENNPGSWTAQKVQRSKERSSNRKCSYCNESGHNRKTCTSFKSDTQDYCGLNYKYQKKVLKAMKAIGFGVGALVKMTDYSDRVKYFMVSKIHWDRVHVANWYRSGMGDEKDHMFQIERIDVSGMSDYDRQYGYGSRTMDMPLLVTNEAGLKKSHYNTDRLELIGPLDNGAGIPSMLDTEAGAGFLRHADYKNTWGSQTIVRMKEKWTGDEY